MTKKKILILGGSGYLGQNIAKRFEFENRYDVTVSDLLAPPISGFTFIQLDVLNKSSINTVLQNYDIIINCTGQITNPINKCLIINTEGIQNISETVLRYSKKLFHISTIAVYGTCDFADEKSELNPESPYSTCKAFAEFEVDKLKIVNPCILRLPNLYGGNQTKGLFAYLNKSFSTDKRLQFNNDGSLNRYFLHISDCAEGIYLALEKELSGTFNITAPENCSLKEIITMVETSKSMKFETSYDKASPIENIKKLSFKAFDEACSFLPEQNIRSYINNAFH